MEVTRTNHYISDVSDRDQRLPLSEQLSNCTLTKEEFFSFLIASFENSPDLVFITDRVSQSFVALNKNAQRFLGKEVSEVKNHSIFEYIKWTSQEAFDKFLKNLCSKQYSGVMPIEILNRRNGEYIKGEVSASQFRFQGRIYTSSCFREYAENAFMRDEAPSASITWNDVESLIDYSGSVIVRWVGNGRAADGQNLEYVSENVNQWGYSQDDFIKYNIRFENLIHPDDVDYVINEARSFYNNKEISTYLLKYRLKRSDDRYIFVESKNWIKRSKSGEILYILSLVNDITYKTRIEEEYIKNQNLDSLGVLAGGIAHDFNNLLTSLTGRLSMLKYNIENREKSRKLIRDAEETLTQAKDLTQQILTFSKGGEPIKKCVDFTKYVTDRINLCLRGSGVKANFSIDNKIECVQVDESQFGQVLNNIVINAVNAMDNDGLLDVKIISEKKEIRDKTWDVVKLSIKDYGPGIPDFLQDKIFEPYFTTKSNGTGLGLAITKSIVEKHDGAIEVESHAGAGTAFHIYLPEGTFTLCYPEEDTGLLGDEKSLKASVLVMDDDDMVRSFMCEALEDLGCRVFQAAHGEEALQVYEDAMGSSKKPDLVIMDLTIPGGMGGKQAIKKMLELDKDVVALVSSGYSVDPVMANYEDYGFKGILSKPFTIDQLSEAIKQALPNRSLV